MAEKVPDWDKYMGGLTLQDLRHAVPLGGAFERILVYSPGREWLLLASLDIAVRTTDAGGLKHVLPGIVDKYVRSVRDGGYEFKYAWEAHVDSSRRAASLRGSKMPRNTATRICSSSDSCRSDRMPGTDAMETIRLPGFLDGKVTEEVYVRWVRNRANAHVRRDLKRAHVEATRVTFRKLIHAAVMASTGCDFYTGEMLDWHLLGTYNNADSKLGRHAYKKGVGTSSVGRPS